LTNSRNHATGAVFARLARFALLTFVVSIHPRPTFRTFGAPCVTVIPLVANRAKSGVRHVRLTVFSVFSRIAIRTGSTYVFGKCTCFASLAFGAALVRRPTGGAFYTGNARFTNPVSTRITQFTQDCPCVVLISAWNTRIAGGGAFSVLRISSQAIQANGGIHVVRPTILSFDAFFARGTTLFTLVRPWDAFFTRSSP
jgi:hypothetical protein